MTRTDATPVIQLDEIVKDYVQADMVTKVLKGVSLTINAGEFAALQGPSGSGKSTLLHIIGLLEKSSGGSYRLTGEDVSDLSDDRRSELRNKLIGFVFQSFYLIPYMSALDNVLLPGLYSRTPKAELEERGLDLLNRVGLADRADFQPSRLSGGQQQRVALARALINDPSLILADEPTGQLDSLASRDIMDLLALFNEEGKTLIVVTHDEFTASYAERIIQLMDGKTASDKRVGNAVKHA